MGGAGLGFGPLGGMPLGGGGLGSNIKTLIEQPSTGVFRRLQIKRRLKTTGKFEPNWQDVSSYVTQWGVLESGVDDVRLNTFVQAGYSAVVNNDSGYFQPESYYKSLWNGYMTRTMSLVRVQAGLYDASLAEYPSDPTQGIFVLTDEIPIRSDSNDVTLKCSSLQSVFTNVLATDIVGINGTATASQILTKIRNHTDGSGNFLFTEFITSTAWTSAATTNNYNPDTVTSLNGITVWDLINDLASAEGLVAFIDRTGGLQFVAKNPKQSVSQFSLTGQNFGRPTVVSIQNYRQDLNNYYTWWDLQYLDANTSTSHVTAGVTPVVSASNVGWQQGVRSYQFKNTLIDNTATAQALVNNLYATLGATLTSIGEFDCLFVPQLDVLDRVDVSYHSYDLGASTIWDVFTWDNANWSAEGENFDWDSKNFYVVNRKVDLDNFKSMLTMREVV